MLRVTGDKTIEVIRDIKPLWTEEMAERLPKPAPFEDINVKGEVEGSILPDFTVSCCPELLADMVAEMMRKYGKGGTQAIIPTTDALVEHLDGLFLAGDIEAARRLLTRLDPQRLPPKVLSGVLMVTKAAKAALGEERTIFFERARAALSETWGLSPEQVASICRRHA